MVKLKPVGSKLIVSILKSEETLTDGGIVAMDFNLLRGKVIEVSDEWSDRYAVGDVVLFPEKSGNSINYQKQSCLWINGKPFTDGGDVWAIEEKESK